MFTKVDVEQGLLYLEKDHDKITKEDLKQIFRELGEDLSHQEIDDMFKSVCKEDRDYVTSEELTLFLQGQ